MTSKQIGVLLFGLVLALMLALPVAAQEGTAIPDIEPSSENFGLSQYLGRGYSLLVPANATVSETDPMTTLILGPAIDIRPGDVDFQVRGNAYQLTIMVEDNSGGLSAEAFATDAILEAYRRLQTEGGPTGGLPVTSSGKLDPNAVAIGRLAGEPAFQVRSFNFDSYTVTFYVAHDREVYEFRFQEDIVENQPIAAVQQDIYALLLATLQFDS